MVICVNPSDDDNKNLYLLSSKEYLIGDIISTLEEQKIEKINQLHTNYDASYNTYLAQYPSAEIATFPTKKKEAEAYSIDNTVATPVIDGIISSIGDTKAVYVQSILDKISYLAQLEGDMVATRDAIKACNTQAELDAIVI